ncbi:hypothetical protein WH96_18800 [Kiloniella spongiae]|uniref:Uncharacterized protein n=1 Tax=Kiloniella spongiae TaxID=1489064 RepID=A0A0H2MA25_9PROT|nr:hypothetical protein [Kiloniella spongiae]KLN59193.1 hypothetical protein WH96_18800 [Kiloniella spongiae]
MPENAFERNVFINCPFDEDYEPILQAMLFCILYLGYNPRIATERNDSGENRLEKIRSLIEESKFSIHDLSRCQASKKGETYRLNMPFELGIDYGCRQYHNGCRDKKFLVLEEKQYRYQASISDISGCDIQTHANDYEKAIRKVRNWLVSEGDAEKIGPARILGAYIYFQQWHYEKQIEAGSSEEDIQDYPTAELFDAMKEWLERAVPV